MKHIVIFRTSGSYIDYNTYNCQELGLSKALTLKGYKVSLIMAGPKAKHLMFDVEGKSIDIYYLTYKSLNQSICVFNGWKKLLENLKPDVVQIHEFGMLMSYFVSKWAKKNSVRCILIQGNYQTTLKPGLKQLECLFNFFFGKKILNNVNAIGCKTKVASQYVARYSHKQTFVTPVGLDESKFLECSTDNNFRQKYNLTNKIILLYVGKMESRRNPLFLLDLMKVLPDTYVLVMVGDGPLKEQVRTRIDERKLSNVLYIGKKKQNELPAIYATSDLFLLASNYEIFGMVILEAMYFGTPVISTSTAGAETLISCDTGVVIQGLDIDEWKDKILETTSNRATLKQMQEKCKKTIKKQYIWINASDKFAELY